MAENMSTIKSKSINKILIANRGEIAVRLIRATRDLAMRSVAVFSEPDEGSIFVRLADERSPLKGASAIQTYLNQDKIILSAIEHRADAIHPGYGFLSENYEFAKKVEDQGIVFIGPSSEVIYKMGDKLRARKIALDAEVPILDGLEYQGDSGEIEKFIKKISYPVIIKASAGGSGRGIRICDNKEELAGKLEEASKEAFSAFGSGVVYIEKYLRAPRHIEVQIVSDNYGSHYCLFDRECSLQRRRQKLVEEAVAPNLHPELSQKIRAAALRLAKAVNYNSVGTMEFLVDGGHSSSDNFYFLEMNTRLQVEHTVTEEVSRIDLAKLQIEIANGVKLDSEQICKNSAGHSIQFRIYAEDPMTDFSPSMGEVKFCHFPSGPGIRIDSCCEIGTIISPYYDALLAKLVVSGNTREEVILRARRAMYETRIEGIKTNIEFFRWLLEQSDFIQGNVHINWILENWNSKSKILPSSFVGPMQSS